MSCSLPFAGGLQRLLDQQLRFVRTTKPVYYRLRNFSDVQTQDWAQLGFTIAPSGSNVGVTDTLIAPPPATSPVSLHNIGQSAGKLRFGATKFMISQTFVKAQMSAQSLADEALVWRNSHVVGLYSDGLLYSIEDITSEQVAGVTLSWFLVCNSLEVK